MKIRAKVYTVSNNIRINSGYTLIELVAIVAIVAIMAAYAINVYKDYSTRARLNEAAQVAHSVRQSIETHVASKRTIPPNEVRSFLGQNMDVVEKVETVRTGSNSIRINVYIKSEIFPDESEQQVFSLLGNIVGGEISWDECGSEGCLTDVSSLPPSVAAPSTTPSTGGSIQIAAAPPVGSPPAPPITSPVPSVTPPAPPVTPPAPPITPPMPPITPPVPPITPPAPPITPPAPPITPPAPPITPPAPPITPPSSTGGNAAGWIAGDIMIIKDSSIDYLSVDVHVARTDRSVVPDTMGPGVHSRSYVGSIANGPIGTIAIGPDRDTTIFVYPKDDFTPTSGIVPCYKLTPGNTVIKGKTIMMQDPASPTNTITDCQVTAGAATPSRGGQPYVSPAPTAADPSEPKQLSSGTKGPAWAGSLYVCREASGYKIEYTQETDSTLFGYTMNKTLFAYTSCNGGSPNGYNTFSVTIRPQTGGYPTKKVYPALDFTPGDNACYIVTQNLQVVVGDYAPRPGMSPCVRRQ